MVQSRSSLGRLAADGSPLHQPPQGLDGHYQHAYVRAGQTSSTFHSTEQASTEDADPPFDPWEDRSRPGSPSYAFGGPLCGSQVNADQSGMPNTPDVSPDMEHILQKQQVLIDALNNSSLAEPSSRASQARLTAVDPTITSTHSTTTNSASASGRHLAWRSEVADSSEDTSRSASVTGIRSAVKQLFNKKGTLSESMSERVTAAKDATVASNLFQEKPSGQSPAAPYRISSKTGNSRGKERSRKKKSVTIESEEEARNDESAIANTVFVKHSSGFHSDRRSGMTKREQLEYVDKLKEAIIDNARVVYPKDTPDVLISKTEEMTNTPFFVSVPQYTANLISFFEGEIFQQILAQSAEHETICDAVEDLHDQATTMLGERLAGLKVGDIVELPPSKPKVSRDASAWREQARRSGFGRGTEDEPVVNVLPPSDEDNEQGCFPILRS